MKLNQRRTTLAHSPKWHRFCPTMLYKSFTRKTVTWLMALWAAFADSPSFSPSSVSTGIPCFSSLLLIIGMLIALAAATAAKGTNLPQLVILCHHNNVVGISCLSQLSTYLPRIGGNLGARRFNPRAVTMAPVVAPTYDRARVLSGIGLSPLLLV